MSRSLGRRKEEEKKKEVVCVCVCAEVDWPEEAGCMCV